MNEMTINTISGFKECIEILNLYVLPSIEKEIEDVTKDLDNAKKERDIFLEKYNDACEHKSQARMQHNASRSFFYKIFGCKGIDEYQQVGLPPLLQEEYDKCSSAKSAYVCARESANRMFYLSCFPCLPSSWLYLGSC